MSMLEAFEILTKLFWENKDKFTPEQIEAWNTIRFEYTKMMGDMIKLMGAKNEQLHDAGGVPSTARKVDS